MTITETRPSPDWTKERRKKRRRRLDSVDAGLVLVAAVLLGVGSHLFTDSLFRSGTDTVTGVVPETLPSTTLVTSTGRIGFVLAPGIDGAVTDHRTMTVRGTATPGAIVSIGGLRSTSLSDGSWAITVLLKPGVNKLAVEFDDGDGSSTARDFTITYQPSAATATVPVAATIGTTPTTVATTASAATTVPTVVTTPAATPTTRPRPRTTQPPTTRATTTSAPATTEPVPVDTEPTP